MNNRRLTKLEKLCKKMCGEGKKFGFLSYNAKRVSPTIKNHIIAELDEINNFYRTLLKSGLSKIERTEKGTIIKHNIHHAGGAWDVRQVITKANVFKGVIFTIILFGKTYVLKCGGFTVKDSSLSGHSAFRMFERCCRAHGIDLNKYSSENGEEIKKEIEPPIIEVYKKHQLIEHVNHVDIVNAYPACVCEKFPEFRPVFEELRQRDKLIGDIALGMCQSQYIGYRYSEIAKAGVNGTREKIKKLHIELIEDDFEVISINTDGIWYRDLKKEGRLFHPEKEGDDLGKIRHDHLDCSFYANSDGQYYFIENGKFNVRARGYYMYEQYKPREKWDAFDFEEAMRSLVVMGWFDGYGFKVSGQDRFAVVEAKRLKKGDKK